MLKLKSIPNNLCSALINEFKEVKKRYILGDWGPGQLKSGRFAEVVLRIFQHLLGETITPIGSNISASSKTSILNKVQNSPSIDEHVRQKITSLTRLLLDFRNNRDSAHLGGFDANQMDSYLTMSATNWIMAELVRVYGEYTMDESQAIIANITTKDFPIIIEIDGEEFLCRHDLKSREEVLAFLYKNESGLDENYLFSKTRDSNKSRFQEMLKKLISEKYIADVADKFRILPRGIQFVEDNEILSMPT